MNSIPDRHVRLERGTMADYHALARFHYRCGRPATVTRIWRLRDDRPTAAQRFRAQGRAPAAPGGGIIGVLVESLPTLHCRQREAALGGRYAAIRDARERALMLKAEVRCISRVIIDPRWRGLGLAVRLIRHALTSAQTVYTEALAAMGRMHPMFIRAGMIAYPAIPPPADVRLIDALRSVGLDIDTIGAADAARRLSRLPQRECAFIEREVDRWLRTGSRGNECAAGDWESRLALIDERLGGWPVYYLFDQRGIGGLAHVDKDDRDRAASPASA